MWQIVAAVELLDLSLYLKQHNELHIPLGLAYVHPQQTDG